MKETELRRPSEFFESGRRFVARYGIVALTVVCFFGLLLTDSWLVVVLVLAIGGGVLLRSRRIALEIDREKGNLHIYRWWGNRSLPFGLIRCYRFGKRYSAGPQRILFVLVDGSRVATYGFCLDELFQEMTISRCQQVLSLLDPLTPCEDCF